MRSNEEMPLHRPQNGLHPDGRYSFNRILSVLIQHCLKRLCPESVGLECILRAIVHTPSKVLMRVPSQGKSSSLLQRSPTEPNGHFSCTRPEASDQVNQPRLQHTRGQELMMQRMASFLPPGILGNLSRAGKRIGKNGRE